MGEIVALRCCDCKGLPFKELFLYRISNDGITLDDYFLIRDKSLEVITCFRTSLYSLDEVTQKYGCNFNTSLLNSK